ncbi:hypothetical protein [Streptomyces sp. NPDC007369]|uniref:hypothetical protein n=1 Tax=Streptomyces sp. NPDC007369 TaxID=3154589 RepID=UPI0033C0F361
MPKRNAHQKAARALQAAEGIGYQEALRRVKAAAEPATEPPTPTPAAVAYALEPTPAEAALGITAEELGVRALPADATPAQRAHAEAVWRPETDPAKPCRCSGRNCRHGAPCAEEDYAPPCTGRMIHVDRHPGSMFDLTAWYDVYECDGCGETFETTVMLPDLPWGEVRTREEADGERYTGVMGEDRVTVIYRGIRHPNFPDRTPGEDGEDEHDLDPDDYPTPEEDALDYLDEEEGEEPLGEEDHEDTLDYLDDAPENDADPIAEPPDNYYDERPDEDELGPSCRVPALDRDPQPTAAGWDEGPRTW